eukprot:3441790-Prymnesium_polylepis.1
MAATPSPRRRPPPHRAAGRRGRDRIDPSMERPHRPLLGAPDTGTSTRALGGRERSWSPARRRPPHR